MIHPALPVLSFCLLGVASAACSSSDGTASCSSDMANQGMTYDITKSRFAFGAPPKKAMLAADYLQWQGPDGNLSLQSSGANVFALASLGPYAPQADLAPATTDIPTAQAYLRDYLEIMGVPSCQIEGVPGSVDAIVQRVIGGIAVEDSFAAATFDIDYQTTNERMYWPAIPEAAVTAAQALRSALASPSALAEYKSKLPSDARGGGLVVLHHTTIAGLTQGPFTAIATYDVTTAYQQYSFDSNGQPVTLPE